MTKSRAPEDALWEGFIPDAARVLRAETGFEEAVADSLERTYDPKSLDRLDAAIAELRATRPAAARLAEIPEKEIA